MNGLCYLGDIIVVGNKSLYCNNEGSINILFLSVRPAWLAGWLWERGEEKKHTRGGVESQTRLLLPIKSANFPVTHDFSFYTTPWWCPVNSLFFVFCLYLGVCCKPASCGGFNFTGDTIITFTHFFLPIFSLIFFCYCEYKNFLFKILPCKKK